MNRPLFSILHPSARPDKWRAVYDDWMSKCDDPSQVEYVLCADERWGFDGDGPKIQGHAPFKNLRMVWNTGRRCMVDAVNAAAKKATGRILIVVADDQFACQSWDLYLNTLLDNVVIRTGKEQSIGEYAESTEFVIEVSTGTPNEHERGIFVMPIVSRARYERLGYLFYPEYESMYADNDLCAHARQDGVVIDARNLVFPHKHPAFEDRVWKNPRNVEMDEAYLTQNRPEAYALGKRIFLAREACGFRTRSEAHSFFPAAVQSPAVPQEPVKDAQGKKILAICYPGERFSAEWVTGFINLVTELPKHGWALQFFPQYTTNVYTTRMAICEMVLGEKPEPTHALWIDDDNIGTPEQVLQLAQDLEEHPDVDVMAGWCWIHHPRAQALLVSCGTWADDGAHLRHYNGPVWMNMSEVKRIDWTGFPFVLMRREALVKAGGSRAFLPIIDNCLESGLAGEDTSWCKRAGAAGVILAADPRVRVHHQKLLAVEPAMPGEKEGADSNKPKGQSKITPAGAVDGSRKEVIRELARAEEREGLYSLAPVRIAGMLRVKNEARWIKRVIMSILPLCNAGVYVLDDNSSDETLKILASMGAILGHHKRSEGELVMFDRLNVPGKGLDEARDKNMLMELIVGRANPDWILCIDGDEELESGGVEKIREELRTTDKDAFTLHVLYLWNSPDQWRVDGMYRNLHRHSLFRPLPGLKFESLYSGAKNPVHTGLHTGNVPMWVRNPEKTGNLDVRLLHYGYMLREDRLRKYAWYNEIDPENEIEDRYRHMVIGDCDIPASTVTKFAGPLKLESVIRGRVFEMDARKPDLPSQPLCLNLGCSDRHEPGFVNVDICVPADQITDLRQMWPWHDSSVSEIRAWDIIEHLPDAIHTMNEAYRVLKPGGRFDIIVPTTDGRGAWQDPTHVSFWNRNSFQYFEAGNPHLHRFEKAYGMRCAFRVVRELEMGPDECGLGVKKLHIVLEAVKEPARANAAD